MLFAAVLAAGPSLAAAKLDKDTCTQLRAEQAGFVQAGLLTDIQRGPEWGKTNLGADRLRDVEHFFQLDEQLKFACREVTLTPEAMRAGEEALRIEANPDADPNAPAPAPDAAKAESIAAPDAGTGDAGQAARPAAKPRVRHRAERHTKPKPAEADAYTPQPGSESTLQAPAATEQPAVKAQ